MGAIQFLFFSRRSLALVSGVGGFETPPLLRLVSMRDSDMVPTSAPLTLLTSQERLQIS
jgi:hypothetical protein